MVEQQLRELIDTLEVGAALPTERTLAECWGVARMTIREAITTLTREGRLQATRGKGTFVQPPPIALRVRLGSFAAELGRAHLNPTTTTLDRRRDPEPPAEARQHLRLRAGAGAAYIERLRLGDGQPLALERAWFPMRFARPLLSGEPPESTFEWMAEQGITPDAGEESVSAGAPHPDEARLLSIPATSTVIRLIRRSTRAGRPVEFSQAVLPASRYELWFPLSTTD
jgi:Transcriptional regulators